MKRIISRFSGRTKLLALGVLLALTAVIAIPTVKADWGPSRPTKQYSDGVAGFDHVTFDSFTGLPSDPAKNPSGITDERQFFNGKYPGATAYSDPMPEVKNGDDLTLEVYVHNNADSSLNTVPDGKGGYVGVAENTTVSVKLPTTSASTQQAKATISASNASPASVYDTLDFGSADGSNFKLSYVPGSASVQYKDANGNNVNKKVSDNIVTTGALIGPNLDGKMDGCFAYVEYVTLHVKVTTAPSNFTLNKKVAAPGDTVWKKSTTAKAGDTVKYELSFKNTGETTLNNVVLRDQLPNGMTIVPGTTKIYNSNYPNGVNAGTDAIVANGGISIGSYTAGANADVDFQAKLPTSDKLKCGENTLTNIGQAITGGVDVTDTAVVTVTKQCQGQPVYTCDAFDISQGDNRTVKVTNFKYTASNGATFSNVVINWGDNTSPLMTNNTVGQTHQYAANGTYNITAVAHFKVNGQDVTATGGNCAKTVTFTTPGTPPQTPPTQLVNTGAGDVFGIFAATAVLGAFAHRLFLSRKLARD